MAREEAAVAVAVPNAKYPIKTAAQNTAKGAATFRPFLGSLTKRVSDPAVKTDMGIFSLTRNRTSTYCHTPRSAPEGLRLCSSPCQRTG